MNYFVSIPFVILMTVLLVGVAWDLRFRRIPNWLTLPAISIAIVYHTGVHGMTGFTYSLGGVGTGIAVLLPFFLSGGMGAGDVKLLGAVGGLLGPFGACVAFLFTALVGGIYAIVLLALHGDLKPTIIRYKTILGTFFSAGKFLYIPPPQSVRKHRLVYGLAIALGTLLSIGLGDGLIALVGHGV